MENFRKIAEKFSWSIVLILGVGYGVFAFWTQDLSEVEARQASFTEMDARQGTLNRKIEEATAFEKQLEQKRKDLQDLEQQLLAKKAELPKAFNIPELLNDIFREAEQVGLEIENVSPAAQEQRYELYASMSVDVRSKGTFIQLFIFLDRLSKLKRLIGVTNVALTAGSREERIPLKGTTAGILAGKRLSGGEKSYKLVRGTIQLMAYRILN